MRGLSDLGVDTRDREEDHNGEEGGEESGKSVLNATVLGHLDNLGNSPANEVHPRHRGGLSSNCSEQCSSSIRNFFEPFNSNQSLAIS